MIISEIVTVADTATLLNQAEIIDSMPGQSIAIRNSSGSSIYLGGEDVTVDNGYELPSNEKVSFDLKNGQLLYAIAEDDTDVSILWIDIK